MIGSTVKNFCKEDPSLIENYELALNDKTQTWNIHHRLEIELNLSAQELKDKGLYFYRPASELIFLSPSEHIKLHQTGERNSMYKRNAEDHMTPEAITEKRRKQSENLKQYYADPEKRKQQSERKKQYWSDPENRKQQSERRKQYWQETENRIKQSERTKQYYKDHPELKSERSKTKKQYYKDHPEKRREQSERMKGKNNPMYGKESPNKGKPGNNKGKHRVYDNLEKTKWHMEFNIF